MQQKSTISFPRRQLPPLTHVTQLLPQEHIGDVHHETQQRLLQSGCLKSLKPGGQIGNGLGIGLADFTTQRFLDEYDLAVTYVNLLTTTEPDAMNTREGPPPLALESDREAMEVALFSALASGRPRVCRLKNTPMLDELWVSEALLEEVNQNPGLRVSSGVAPLEFDQKGNLF